MVESPLFSIIMPTHNRGSLISTGIESVIDQTYADWEFIIIDDGSTDNTKAVIESYKDSRIRYYFQEHKERSTARNKGIELARGKYICFLDDDDYLKPNFLMDFYQYLSDNNYPMKILRTGFYRSINGTLNPSTNYQQKNHGNPVKFALFNMCGVWSLCIPQIFLKEKKFSNEIHYWEDTHLILQLLIEHPFVQLDAYQYVYELHDEMSSIQFYKSPDLHELVKNNIYAMKDFFSKFGDQASTFVPSWSKNFIIAEKYLDHAIGSAKYGRKGDSFFFMKKSLSYPSFQLNLLKKYIIWILKFIF